jgi:hypothetical protein
MFIDEILKDINKNLTPGMPQKVSILKSSSLKNTAIPEKSIGIDSKFDSLSTTVQFFDLQIFSSGELLPANFYRYHHGRQSIGTGTREFQ